MFLLSLMLSLLHLEFPSHFFVSAFLQLVLRFPGYLLELHTLQAVDILFLASSLKLPLSLYELILLDHSLLLRLANPLTQLF